MRERDETELDPHLPDRPEAEPLEAVVELYVPEHGLRLNGTPAPMHQPPFAGKEVPGLPLQCVCPMIHLHDPALRLSLVAHASQGTAGASGRTVDRHAGVVTEL